MAAISSRYKKTLKPILAGFTERYGLSDRESDIIEVLAHRVISAEDIGAYFGISPNTVRIHFARMFRKTGVASKTELLALLLEYALD